MTFDNRHSIALPYWARPGFMLVTNDDGGGGGDDDDDDDAAEDEDDEEDDPDAGKTEDELRAELKAAREALSKASGSSKAKRDKIKELKRQLAAVEGGAGGGDDDDDDDDDEDDAASRKKSRQAVAAERERADNRIKKAEARGALRGAGIDPKRLERAVGLIDLDELDVDDDGNVDGLDEALDALRDEWPELFAKQTRRRRDVAGREDRDGSGGGGGRKLSTAERHAQRLAGRG